KSIASN
ncbi:hypothetical protein D018_1190B, partial [Vibrio parahaemolyticus VP2007-007]